MEKAECMEAAAGTVGSDDSAEIGLGAEPADIPRGARVKKPRSEDDSETSEKRRRNSKGNSAYGCPDCDYVTKHRGHYRCHLITHTTEKPYTCTECQMGFNRKSNLVRHKYSHSKQNPLLCPGCPLRFKVAAASGALSTGIKTPSMEKAECMKAAADTTGSDDSAEIGLGAGLEAIPCGSRVKRSRSQKTSETSEKRRRNSKAHVPYWCPDCDYVSNHRGRYMCHLFTHTPEKPYTCPKCQMGFNRKANLLRHQYSHTKEKPLSCPFCPRRFKIKYSLDRHILFRHTKETKPFLCETCGKRLSRLDSLTRHQRIHTENHKMTYSCSVCLRTFGHRHSAKRHEKTMHAPPAASPRETAASPPGEEKA